MEYAQRVRAYWPRLRSKGINRCLFVINGEPSQCSKLAELVNLPSKVELLSDPAGEAGRAFGCSRGFLPDEEHSAPLSSSFAWASGWARRGTPFPPCSLAILATRVASVSGSRARSRRAGRTPGRWPAILDVNEEGTGHGQ